MPATAVMGLVSSQRGFGRADADDDNAEAGAEASAGDGLRRTRRPRAATRNISELLADAEDSFGEEDLEAEPEPDSEQGVSLSLTLDGLFTNPWMACPQTHESAHFGATMCNMRS